MTYNGKHPAQLGVELDTVLKAIAVKAALPALSVDIDIAGSRISRAYREEARPVSGDERPVFASGCLADIFIAIICLDQHQRHGLDLDAPFESILPELTPLVRAEHPVTVRHLLTRTGGMQDPRTIEEMRALIPWDTFAERVRTAKRLFTPGAVFNYGGIDRGILNRLVATYAGESIDRLARKSIVDPAGIHIREIQYAPPQADGFRAIAKFDTATLLDVVAPLARRDGSAAANPFPEGLRNQLQIERIPLSRSLRVQPWPHAPTAFTYGLFKFSDGLIGFNGWQENQSCAVRMDPQDEVSYVVALEGPPGVRDVIVAEIAQRLGYESVQSRGKPCTIGGLNGVAPNDVLGVYAGWAEGYEANVTLEGGILACELNYRGDKFQRVRARLEDGGWLVVDSAINASALEFFRDGRTGRVCLASGYLPYAKAA
ncbi:MAG TPA: serine hydrolase domain-containing protein [Caulobacteraceae bacterium]|jgi:hypothetical protein